MPSIFSSLVRRAPPLSNALFDRWQKILSLRRIASHPSNYLGFARFTTHAMDRAVPKSFLHAKHVDPRVRNEKSESNVFARTSVVTVVIAHVSGLIIGRHRWCFGNNHFNAQIHLTIDDRYETISLKKKLDWIKSTTRERPATVVRCFVSVVFDRAWSPLFLLSGGTSSRRCVCSYPVPSMIEASSACYHWERQWGRSARTRSVLTDVPIFIDTCVIFINDLHGHSFFRMFLQAASSDGHRPEQIV